MVSDSAANVTKAIRDGKLKHVAYANHTFQLCINEVLKSQNIEDVTALLKSARKSMNARKELHKIQKCFSLPELEVA